MSEGGALRQVFAEFGIRWNTSELDAGSQSVSGAISHVRQLGEILAGNQIVQGIREFASQFEEAAGRVQDTADMLGTTTTELQELQHAAVMSGLSTEAASNALAHFQQASAGAATGAAGPAAAFRALGVHVKDAHGAVRPMSDLLDDLAVNFSHVEDPARRAQLAQDFFGRSGTRMANVMHEGAGGLAALRAELGELGGGMFPEAMAAANEYGDATDRMRVAQDSLRSVLAVELLPVLTGMVIKTTEITAEFAVFARGTHFAKIAVGALGVAAVAAGADVLIAFAPAILTFAAVAAAVAIVGLAFDDVTTMINGGDSALGRFLDKRYGIGTTQAFVLQLREAWEGVRMVVDQLGTESKYLFGAAMPQMLQDVEAFVNRIDRALSRIGTSLREVTSVVTMRGMFGGLAFGQQSAAGAAGAHPSAPGAGPVTRGIDTSHPGERSGWQTMANIPRDVLAGWGNVFSGRHAALAASTTAPAPTPTAPAVTHRSTVNHIAVHGVTDPHAAAAEAVRLLDERERAEHDGDHPQRAGEI